MTTNQELSPQDLRCLCDQSLFDFETTAELKPLDEVIGQRRAVEAIDFGLNMKGPGYHIFVTGQPGTGKSTIVQDIVNQHARELDGACDWCMVNNFNDEYRPQAIALPPAGGPRFAKQIEVLMTDLRVRLQKAFEDEAFQESATQIQNRYGAKKRQLFEQLEQVALTKNLRISKTPDGYLPIPVKDDKPLNQELFQQLPEEERKAIEGNIREIKGETENVLREAQKLNQAQQTELESVLAKAAQFVVQQRLRMVTEAYQGWPQVVQFIESLQADIVENVGRFLTQADEQSPDSQKGTPHPARQIDRYQVNVLVNRGNGEGAPVVFEPNPTYQNVFGRIEKRALMGVLTTDFTMVQAGALLQANGGFLIMEMESVLTNPNVWDSLKRALQNRMLLIEDVAVSMGFATASLRPQPIDLDVKVILIGGYDTFHTVQMHDPKFSKTFKVRADFDHETERHEESLNLYARFVARVCRTEKLLPFTAAGVAAVVEYGGKNIADQQKLSLRFGPVVDMIKEADYWARRENCQVVTDSHVAQASRAYRNRISLYEEKVHERYADNAIMIDTEGAVVGQVNALAVYQVGEFAFGRPSRITAETFLGKPGVINIERESKMSGKTHDKGVLILTGYLGRTFARNYPLSLAISITFEQSYSGIDGDSASSTELYAILSSLAASPINQGIAVTGSVNQKGQVQAIGGVNQKIEGFFDICRTKGLTGSQGVMIPQANVRNLMLKPAVVDAATEGKFHIYAVATIEQGIEILTGLPTGRPDEDGKYGADTLFGEVQQELKRYFLLSRIDRDSKIEREDSAADAPAK